MGTALRLISASALLSVLLVGRPANAVAPRIAKGPWVQRVTSATALVRVEVAPPAAVTLEIGSGSDPTRRRTYDSNELRSRHAFPVTGLEPSTRYTYSVRVDGVTKAAAFVTAPPDASDRPFHFLVYGDNRSDDAGHAAVVRAMVPSNAELLVHTGDFVENGASPSQWQTFFDVESPLLTNRAIYTTVGNHELTDGAGLAYAQYFGPADMPPAETRPEHLDDTARWGNTRFFFINGMVSYASGVDRRWLENALAAADDEKGLVWRIVVVHHGPWSSGPHGNNARLHDAGVVALLKRHKVDLVLAGHDHIYERGWDDGLAYVVSGGGGAPPYRIKSRLPQTRSAEAVRHFVDVGVSSSALQIVATRSDSSIIERCGLAKGSGWDCDPPIRPPSETTAPGSSRCTCDVVGARRDGAPSLVGAVLGATALAAARRRRRAAGP